MAKAKNKSTKGEGRPSSAKAEGISDAALLLISKAVADPTRLAVFRKIAQGDTTCCGQLLEGLHIKAATLSHHLKELESAGLIETAREGKFIRATIRRKTWKSYLTGLKCVLPR